jgi:hypothetical protein
MSAKLRLLLVATLTISLSSQTQAQTDHHRLEVGIQYTSLTLSRFDSVESGIGGRFGVRVHRYLTVETEYTFFPKSELGNSGLDQKGLGLVGVKSGISNRWVGLFGKFRPGMMTFASRNRLPGLCRVADDTVVCNEKGSGNKLALDMGGVFEAYPTPGVVIRADLGDTIIRFRDDTFFTFPIPTRVRDGWSHNLQVTVGVGLRF